MVTVGVGDWGPGYCRSGNPEGDVKTTTPSSPVVPRSFLPTGTGGTRSVSQRPRGRGRGKERGITGADVDDLEVLAHLSGLNLDSQPKVGSGTTLTGFRSTRRESGCR